MPEPVLNHSMKRKGKKQSTETENEAAKEQKEMPEDACRVEHYISDKTFKAIKKHLKNYPEEKEN